jgi:hypothetical protein
MVSRSPVPEAAPQIALPWIIRLRYGMMLRTDPDGDRRPLSAKDRSAAVLDCPRTRARRLQQSIAGGESFRS